MCIMKIDILNETWQQYTAFAHVVILGVSVEIESLSRSHITVGGAFEG